MYYNITRDESASGGAEQVCFRRLDFQEAGDKGGTGHAATDSERDRQTGRDRNNAACDKRASVISSEACRSRSVAVSRFYKRLSLC